MEITVSRIRDINVIALAGRIETEDAFTLKKKLGALRHDGGKRFILDLHRVPFLNSYALGILIHIRSEAKNFGGDMVLAAPEDNIDLLFDMVGMGQFIQIFPSMEKAVGWFERDGIDGQGTVS